MKKALVAAALVFVVGMVSCTKTNLDKGLFGTWNVTLVEGVLYVNGDTAYAAVDSVPSGTVRFRSDGTGEQDYTFMFAGTTYPNTDHFKWEANDVEIIIKRTSEPDLVWNRITDEENKQVARYTTIVNAAESWDYTLTLEH